MFTKDLMAAELDAPSDHDLLAGGLFNQMAENFYASERLARLDEFRCRLERDYEARRADEPHFTLTPLQETAIEAGELWGYPKGRVAADLRVVRTLKEHFEDIWGLCRSGQLDTYKGSLIAETAKFSLDHPKDFAAFARRLTAWLRAGVVHDDERPPLVNRTTKQLRNKLNYEVNKLKQKSSDERFKQAFKQRKSESWLGENGMGELKLINSVHKIQLADYRLTLIAKDLRAKGDTRILDQLRTDLAIDLIMGRLDVSASIRELEDAGEDGVPTDAFRELPTSNYARPVVNVTVPLQTLMGTSDEPGVLSGGTVIPASLARQIAQQPESTWFRMLTDPHGHCIELSTKSYRPTRPIWRDVVARYTSCFRRNCDRPATICELDHRVPWPKGQTSTTNLAPACCPDHKGKHAPGFGLEKSTDGSLTLKTRAGFRHTTEAVEHPVSDEWPDEDLFDIQFTATEICEAIQHLRDKKEAIDNSTWLQWRVEKLWASYRASYPDATDDDIHYWIHSEPLEPEEEHHAPPLLVNGYTRWELMAERRLRSGEASLDMMSA